MSEKFNKFRQKVKNGVENGIFIIPIIIGTILITLIFYAFFGIIEGAIFSICWNIGIVAMFNVNKITILQATIVTITIGILRKDYSNLINVKLMETDVDYIFTIIAELAFINIAVLGIMYSWNTIIPKLLTIKLTHINYIHAVCFGYVFNRFFSINKSREEKSEEKRD